MENTKPKVHPQWEQRAIILGVADFLCLLASYFFATDLAKYYCSMVLNCPNPKIRTKASALMNSL